MLSNWIQMQTIATNFAGLNIEATGFPAFLLCLTAYTVKVLIFVQILRLCFNVYKSFKYPEDSLKLKNNQKGKEIASKLFETSKFLFQSTIAQVKKEADIKIEVH